MIITKEEYGDMGFQWDNDKELESCLARAEYVISALTQGRYSAALAAGGAASNYVKQAAAFQTSELLEREYASENETGGEERYTLGDFSYTSSHNADSGVSSEPFDSTLIVVSLLRAAGCLYGAMEVAE